MPTADDHVDAVTLLLIDAHAMFREGIAAYLAGNSDIALIDEAASWREALLKPAARRASILLLGVNGPNERAADFIVCLNAGGFTGQLLILDGGLSAGEPERLLELGAAGIICKRESPSALVEAIRRASRGGVRAIGALTKSRSMGRKMKERESNDLTGFGAESQSPE